MRKVSEIAPPHLFEKHGEHVELRVDHGGEEDFAVRAKPPLAA